MHSCYSYFERLVPEVDEVTKVFVRKVLMLLAGFWFKRVTFHSSSAKRLALSRLTKRHALPVLSIESRCLH